uniref:Uncharacterized protein n=2 Tax=Cacopsylla melanoneura TaxID=428564 RepID=A0A8D9B8B8_9HEMI
MGAFCMKVITFCTDSFESFSIWVMVCSVGEKSWLRSVVWVGQVVRICLIVRRSPHSQDGGSSLFNLYCWVRRLCPVLNLTSVVSTLLDLLNEVSHVAGRGLISESLVVLPSKEFFHPASVACLIATATSLAVIVSYVGMFG